MKNGKWILAGPSSSFCSVITIPERFPRRAQQREKASSTVLKTLTNLRYKRRLSSDVNVGTSQPQLKSARSTDNFNHPVHAMPCIHIVWIVWNVLLKRNINEKKRKRNGFKEMKRNFTKNYAILIDEEMSS
ncbi:ubiquitin-conjugating enzyme E2 [Apis cerana cerana]|uniref:Ubiquitin-conjugating enzyme E2 n=1 Tax=Apis cerana cerana TaxID=94128 RepID=A0A2A3ESV2_APICC|nr:ubiquitin-conjugating enzyme E2 [Apis cerana cerana]